MTASLRRGASPASSWHANLRRDRSHLLVALDVHRSARARQGRVNRWLRFYELTLILLLIGVPIGRVVTNGLGAPAFTQAVSGATGANLISVTVGGFALSLLVVGSFRGPVVPSGPYIDQIASSPISRRVSLGGFLTQSAALLATVGGLSALALVAGVANAPPVVVPIETSGSGLSALAHVDPAGAVIFILGGVLAGWQIHMLWLIGQIGGRLRICALRVLIVILVVTIAEGAVAGAQEPWAGVWLGPWGWAGVLFSRVSEGMTAARWWALTLLMLGVGLACACRGLAGAVSLAELASQSQRWAAVSMLAASGDVQAAAQRLTPAPYRGRSWRWPMPSVPVAAILVRDCVGLARFPWGTGVGVLAALGAGSLMAMGRSGPPGAALIASAVTPLLAYAAVGMWTRGLRQYTSWIGASTPFGLDPLHQSLGHIVVPGVLGVASIAGGLAVARSLTAGMAHEGAAAQHYAFGGLLAVFVMGVHLLSAAKGPMPVGLLMPVPTPLGDLAALSLAMWLADGFLIIVIFGGGASIAHTLNPESVAPMALLGVGVVGVAAWARSRLRRLSSS